MIAIFNSLPVREGAADRVVEMFVNSRGAVQGFPGFVSMEVLRSEGAYEVLVVTRWQSRKAFEAWGGRARSSVYRPHKHWPGLRSRL